MCLSPSLQQGSLLAVLFALSATAICSKETPKKRPVPTAKRQATAEKLVKEIYKDEYSSAKEEKGKRKLLTLLLDQAPKTTDDEDARFVLFREARDLAAQLGEAATALRVVDMLAQEYEIKVLEMKTAVLTRAAGAVLTAEANKTLANLILPLLADALEADEYESAGKLQVLALAAAKKAKDDTLLAEAKNRGEEIRTLEKAFSRVKDFAVKLQTDPKDTKANLEVGKFFCLYRENWERGLPLLVKGSEAALKALAEKDLTRPAGAKDQTELANGWSKLAGSEKDAARAHLLRRAYFWYQQAALNLEKDEKAKMEKRLADIRAQLPSPYQIYEIVGEIRRFDGHKGNVMSVALSRDGQKALTGSADRTVRLWSVKTGKELLKLEGHTNWVRSVAFTLDGQHALSAGDDNTLRLWDLKTGEEVRKFTGHKDWVKSLALLPDGQRVLSGSDDHTLELWEVESGKELRKFTGHAKPVLSVAVSRDGRRAVSGSEDATVRIWDVDNGQELYKCAGHTEKVTTVAFSPDGRRVVSGSVDGTIRLWVVQTGKELRRFQGQPGVVWSVAFSPDARRVISGSGDQLKNAGPDNKVRVWDVESGKELRRLEGHLNFVYSVVFSADGRLALTGSADKTARLWGEMAK
jgi:hypothetical protein